MSELLLLKDPGASD